MRIMQETTFLQAAFAVFSLLGIATALYPLSRWTKIPFAVNLLVAGLGLGYFTEHFHLPLFEYFHFSPEIIFYVFLPTLIFESAYHLNFRHFQGVLKEVVSLAFLGLILSTAIIGVGLYLVLQLPLEVSLLFGALISATDPIAVLAIFREMKVPPRLATIVDGESLINDGTALVLFQFFFKIAVLGGVLTLTPQAILWEGGHLLTSILMGVIVGSLLGLLFSYAIAHAKHKGVQLTLSLILAHITFLIAEGLLHVSGILATLTAGLIMGNFGGRKLKSEVKKTFSEIWEFLGFVSNALLFLLLGIKLSEISFIQYLFPIAFSFFLTIFLARPLSVVVSLVVAQVLPPPSQRFSWKEQCIISWGGIRGALAAAAVLLIPEDFPYREMLQAMTAGVIMGTFLLNALSMRTLLKILEIGKQSIMERFQKTEAKLVINEEICKYLDTLCKKKYISPHIHEILKKEYLHQHQALLCSLKEIESLLHNNERAFEKILTQFALGIELNTYKQLFDLDEIYEERFVVLRESIFRQLHRLQQDILPEEYKGSQKYAPEIPENIKDYSLSWLLSLFGLKALAEKVFRAYQARKIISRLQHYRARRIASWKVIQDFKRLQKDHPLFRHPIVDKLIQRYLFWNKNAEKKMAELEKKYASILYPYRIQLAQRACLEKIASLEKEFYQKGFISEKIHEELFEELLDQKQKYCRYRLPQAKS